MSRMKSLFRLARRFLSGPVLFALLYLTGCERNSGIQLEALLNPDLAAMARLFVGHEGEETLPVTLVDVDDDTFRRLEYPPEVPREYLLDLMEAVARRKAAAIIMDIDLTATRSASSLDAVAGRLQRLVADDPDGPAIILIRRLWPARRGAAPNASTVQIPGVGTRQEAFHAALFRLDALVEASPRLVWAAALHSLESDGTIRFSRAAELVCGFAAEPQGGTLPRDRLVLSPPVIVASRLVGSPSDLGSLKAKATAIAAEACRKGVLDSNAALEAIGLRPFLNSQGKARVPYYFSRYRPIRTGSTSATDLAGGRTDLFHGPVSADQLVRGDEGMDWSGAEDVCSRIDDTAGRQHAPMACKPFAGQVVVIGASHVDSADRHSTPLGMMPGMDIVANGVVGARHLLKDSAGWHRDPLPVALLLVGAVLGIGALAQFLLRRFGKTASEGEKRDPEKTGKLVHGVTAAATILVFTTFGGLLGIDPATAYSSIWLAVSFLVLQPLVAGGGGLVGKPRAQAPGDTGAPAPKA